MRIIDADKFLSYLIFSKHIDELTCGEVKEAIEVCKVDILDKIRAEIKPKCDRINSLASVLPYTAHREIQELLCDIMNLCKIESEDNH